MSSSLFWSKHKQIVWQNYNGSQFHCTRALVSSFMFYSLVLEIILDNFHIYASSSKVTKIIRRDERQSCLNSTYISMIYVGLHYYSYTIHIPNR